MASCINSKGIMVTVHANHATWQMVAAKMQNGADSEFVTHCPAFGRRRNDKSVCKGVARLIREEDALCHPRSAVQRDG